MAGDPFLLLAEVSDPSAADEAAGFTYEVTWSDDAGVAAPGPGRARQDELRFVLREGATTATVIAIDRDGLRSAPRSN